MRDLVFKNLTSSDKSRRIIASSEVIDKEGVHSVIHRHFICKVQEVSDKKMENRNPSLYVLKERNSKELKERFFCRIKGSMYAVSNEKLYLISFMHSLKINLHHVQISST